MERLGEKVVIPEISEVFTNAASVYRYNITSKSTCKKINK